MTCRHKATNRRAHCENVLSVQLQFCQQKITIAPEHVTICPHFTVQLRYNQTTYLARSQGLELLHTFLRGGVGDAQLGDVVGTGHTNALAGGRQVQRIVLGEASLGARRDDRILLFTRKEGSY